MDWHLCAKGIKFVDKNHELPEAQCLLGFELLHPHMRPFYWAMICGSLREPASTIIPDPTDSDYLVIVTVNQYVDVEMLSTFPSVLCRCRQCHQEKGGFNPFIRTSETLKKKPNGALGKERLSQTTEPNSALGKEPNSALGKEPNGALGKERNSALCKEPGGALKNESNELSNDSSKEQELFFICCLCRSINWCSLATILRISPKFMQYLPYFHQLKDPSIAGIKRKKETESGEIDDENNEKQQNNKKSRTVSNDAEDDDGQNVNCVDDDDDESNLQLPDSLHEKASPDSLHEKVSPDSFPETPQSSLLEYIHNDDDPYDQRLHEQQQQQQELYPSYSSHRPWHTFSTNHGYSPTEPNMSDFYNK